MTRTGPSLLPAYVALALSMAIVGANVPLAKYLGASLPVDLIIAGRCLAAALALAPLAWSGTTARYLIAERWAFLGFGMAGVVGYPFLMVSGLKWTGALSAGAIAATMPAVIALLSIWLLRERLSATTWAAVALAVCGVALLNLMAGVGPATGAAPLWGNLIILAAVCCEAIYVIQAKSFAARLPALTMAFGINVAGCLITVPMAVSTLIYARELLLPPAAAMGVIWYGLSSSVVALLLWFWGMARVPAARAGLFTVFLPLTAAFLSIVLLGESATSGQWFGIALVLAAIALAARNQPEPAGPVLPLTAKLASSNSLIPPHTPESAGKE